LIDGAVEAIPGALADQLRDGGRVVTGLSDRGVTRIASGVRTGGGVAPPRTTAAPSAPRASSASATTVSCGPVTPHRLLQR
ncbi:hypothetical protein K4H03_29065, partial [Mycobacterium tuberculosis]|nr:hypothetical protein [Mycobacterium tuberculosis]